MMAKRGDLKVWWVPQAPMEQFEIPVPDTKTAAFVLNVLAEYDAFQFLNSVKPDYCNAGGLIEFDGEDWFDWIDPETSDEDPGELHPQQPLGWCAKL